MSQIAKYTAQVGPSPVDEGLYEATFRELGRTLVTIGDSPEEAFAKLYLEGPELLSEMEQDGDAIPDPEAPPEWLTYSGRLTLRMPRSLHCKLHMLAVDEGVSLNTLAVSVLSWGAEQKHCSIRPLMPSQVDNRTLFVNVQMIPPATRMLVEKNMVLSGDYGIRR